MKQTGTWAVWAYAKPGRLRPVFQVFLARFRRLGTRACALAGPGHPTPQFEPQAWSKRLKEEKDALLSLVRGMEAEFLANGDGLERLTRQLDEIQKECLSLSDLTLGRGQDAAVQFAFQLLKKAEDFLLAGYEQYDHVFATFGELQQRLTRLAKQRDELMRVLLPLNFVTVSFRIEASRHPIEVQQNFSALADTVNQTVNEVRQTLVRQFEDLAMSEFKARDLMDQASKSIQSHRREVTATLETTRRQLNALSQALTDSGAGVTNLTDLNKAVTNHICGIVMAQQCQDITRQSIEHVGEAMDEMHAHIGDAPANATVSDPAARQFVHHAGQIQLHQVQNVFGQLNNAADSIKSGIQSLRTEAATAAEVSVKMGATTLNADIAGQCQAGIGEILGIVKQAVQKIADIIAAFAPLQASFVDCTRKATGLAVEVRRAGLNAQVFSIRTSNGATLEVLAGRVRAISEEVIHEVGVMGAALSHTTELINNLRQRLEDFQQLSLSEQEILTAESVSSREKLAQLKDAIPLLIKRLSQHQGVFVQSVEEVLANIQFPVAVAKANSRSISFFQELVAWGAIGSLDLQVESGTAQKIDRLQSKYTMASERHAHTAALRPISPPEEAAGTSPAIELFDEEKLPPTGDPVGTAGPPREPPHDEPAPAVLSASVSPLPSPVVAEERPPASAELGDNVELF